MLYKKIYFLLAFLSLAVFLNAQVSVQKQLSFNGRVLAAGLYNENGKTDTVVFINPNKPVIMVDVPGFTPPKSEVPDKKPYIQWGPNRKTLSENESVLGISSSAIIIKKDQSDTFALSSCKIKNGKLEVVAKVSLKKVTYGRVEPLFSPDGKFFSLYLPNSFSADTGKKLECYNEKLEKIMSYKYRYGIRVEYYFVNKDTLCLYEADPATRKVYLQLFSVSLQHPVYEKEIQSSVDFVIGLPQVKCVVISGGFAVVANSESAGREDVRAYNFAGDTLWHKNFDYYFTEMAFIPLTGEITFFCNKGKEDSPVMLTINQANGLVTKKTTVNQLIGKDFIRKGEDPAFYMFYTPVLTSTGYVVFPVFAYNYINSKQVSAFCVVLTNGTKQTTRQLKVDQFAEYSICPYANGKVVYTSNTEVLITK